MLNSVLPSTDLCEWLKYFWPTSDAEVSAVQEFFVAKVKGLHEVIVIGLVWQKNKQIQNNALVLRCSRL